MTVKDFGGPAFPGDIRHEGEDCIVGFLGEEIEPGHSSNYAGMSLRDNEALLLLASARKGVARVISETGKFIVVEKT